MAEEDGLDTRVRLCPILYNIEEDLARLTGGFIRSPREEQQIRIAKILVLVGLVHRSQEVVGPAAHQLWLVVHGIPLILEMTGDKDDKKIADAIRIIAMELAERSTIRE